MVYAQHDKYMIEFFRIYFSLMESNNKPKLINYITNFVFQYKSKLLDINYYRELNIQSSYRLNVIVEKNIYGIANIDNTGFESIDIAYNYFNYLVPMCTMLI